MEEEQDAVTLEMFATWVAVGLVTGWLGGIVMRDGGHGWFWDLLLGLAGSGAASTLATTLEADPGRIAMLAVAVGGAALVIVVQRKIGPAVR